MGHNYFAAEVGGFDPYHEHSWTERVRASTANPDSPSHPKSQQPTAVPDSAAVGEALEGNPKAPDAQSTENSSGGASAGSGLFEKKKSGEP